MTTKQIAAAVGRSERTVRGWISRLTAKLAEGYTDRLPVVNIAKKVAASSPSNPADYDLEETIAIIEKGLGANAAEVYKMNAQAVPPSADSTERRLDRLEGLVEKLVAALQGPIEAIRGSPRLALPAPAELEPRDALRKIVEGWARTHGRDYQGAWASLYREYGYRYHRDIARAAKNRGQAVLDYADAENLVGELLALAYFLYGQRVEASA